MKSSEKPEIIKKIEALWGGGFKMKEAPKYPSLLDGLYMNKKEEFKYAMDGEGRVIGLNLVASSLNDSRWQAITQILGENIRYLQAINLNENQLKEVKFPSGMKVLKLLDLSENQLEVFELADGMDALEELKLEDNPISSPPPEVIQQGSESVLAWFASFKKEDGPVEYFLKEIKILLVGEGLAGKTSLLKQIKGMPFDKEENQTHGVNVETLPVKDLPLLRSYKTLEEVILRIWDFGGQEIMHASHQFFLTHRSIYIFVLDSRTDNRKEYWLRHIQKFGGGSPAIVAINKMDENTNYSLEESTLNRKYPFVENRFIKISCKTGIGMPQLAETLARLIPETPLLKTPISSSWFKIKQQLEKDTGSQRYINRERFIAICEAHGEENETGQNTLLRYLNALGVVLHFPDLSLQEFFVLDPHWVTIGVYKIINSPSISNGLLQAKDLNYILNKEEQKNAEYAPSEEKAIDYTNSEQLYLISIMKEFELLYEYQKEVYLVPDLLPKELEEPVEFDRREAVEFIMEYDFLPPNVMSRFLIQLKNDVHGLDYLWRTGVLLSNEKYNCRALVEADMETKRISIAVNGEENRKRDYFAIVRHGLCVINEKFDNLKITEKMPIPGYPDLPAVDYEELLGLEKMGTKVYPIGRIGKEFNVSEDFLNKVSSKENRQYEKGKDRIDININFDNPEKNKQLNRIEDKLDNTGENVAMLSNHVLQMKYLEELLIYAEAHQADIEILYTQIDAIDPGSQDLVRVNDFLEKQLDRYFAYLKPAHTLVKDWEKAKTQQIHVPNSKWKLKLKFPFLFGSFEKELSYDMNIVLQHIRSEIKAYTNGEKTFKELFVDK